MEISTSTSIINASVTRKDSSATQEKANAYGIGSANQTEVTLSAQARILQQNEQQLRSRQEAVNAQAESTPKPGENNDYVRVSSSVGTAQRNNLPNDKATELYRSIEKML